MKRLTDTELLKACVARMGSRLEPAEESALQQWWEGEENAAYPSFLPLLQRMLEAQLPEEARAAIRDFDDLSRRAAKPASAPAEVVL